MDVECKFESTLRDCFRFYLRHNLTLTALEDMMRLLNSVSNDKHFPTSKYKLFQYMESNIDTQYYVKCATCNEYKQNPKGKADLFTCDCGEILKAEETNFFVYFSIVEQLVNELSKNEKYINRFYNDSKNSAMSSTGTVMSSLLHEMSPIFPLPLQLFTDGVQVNKSNSNSLWPILVIQNFLPPNIRFKKNNVICAGLYYGNEKPNMCQFFLPLIKDLKDKIFDVFCENKTMQFQPVVSSFCVDLPAKAMVQCFVQCNGYNSCTYCKHPGCRVKNPHGTVLVRFTNGKCMEPRTHEETLISMMENFKRPNSTTKVDGVKSVSCIVGLDHADTINMFGIDYMHNCLLGVGSQLFDLWINSSSKKMPYYIPPKKRAEINERMESIKLCSFIKRTPRNFDHKNKFKANEIRTLILYCLPIFLRGILPHTYYDHFRIFSSALHTLLKVNVSEAELVFVKKNLEAFVESFEKLYGQHTMVMNVHLLHHLVDAVRCHGPLWAQSAFAFESFNGVLARYVVGAKEILLQITSKYLLSRSLKKKDYQNEGSHSDELLGRSSAVKVSEEELTALQNIGINNLDLSIFKRYKSKTNIVYTSEVYKKAKRTVDFFVKTTNQNYGSIKYFFQINGHKLCMLKCYDVISTLDHFTKIVESNKCLVISVDHIEQKQIHLEVYQEHYVTFEPNPFERE